jgi:hypothetical protein
VREFRVLRPKARDDGARQDASAISQEAKYHEEFMRQ